MKNGRIFIVTGLVCLWSCFFSFGVVVDNKTYTNGEHISTHSFTWAVGCVNTGWDSSISFNLPTNEISISVGATFKKDVYLYGNNKAGAVRIEGKLTFEDGGFIDNFGYIREVIATNEGSYINVYDCEKIFFLRAGDDGTYSGNAFINGFIVGSHSTILSNQFGYGYVNVEGSNTIRGNVFSNGVEVSCQSGNTFENNYGLPLRINGNTNTVKAGTMQCLYVKGDANSVSDAAVASGWGVVLYGDDNSIDALTVQANRSAGLEIQGTGNTVKDCIVCRNKGPGILVTGTNITIGGSEDNGGNKVYGNFGGGIKVYNSDQVKIMGNWIGSTNQDYDAAASGNVLFGVQVKNSYNVQLGLLEAGKGNSISGNAGMGVQCIATEEGDNLYFNANLNAIVKNLGHGVDFSGGTNWHLHGNFIGVEENKTDDLGNAGHGVNIANKAMVNIGGTAGNARNIISGNKGCGIYIEGYRDASLAGCKIQNNYIGTRCEGDVAVGNGVAGIMVKEGRDVLIGGDQPGEGNLISGNKGTGIMLTMDEYSRKYLIGCRILGNDIGVDSTGTNALGNLGGGIYIVGQSNVVGGITSNMANVVCGNENFGICLGAKDGTPETKANVVQGNFVGVDRSGVFCLGNQGHGILLDASDSTYKYVVSNTVGVTDGYDLSGGNVIANNTGCGVLLKGGVTYNLIDGNIIGLNPSQSKAMPNAESGVKVADGFGYHNEIGGRCGNVISGNGVHGVDLFGGDHNDVCNNQIGTDRSCSRAFGNGGNGVCVSVGSYRNTIGGNRTNEGNVIVFNGLNGIQCEGQENEVMGNYIGLLPLGNQTALNSGRYGILSHAQYMYIGGKEDGQGNWIDATVGIGIVNAGTNSGTLRHFVDGNVIGYHPLSALPATNLEYGIYIEGSSSYSRVGADAGNWIGGATEAGIYVTNVRSIVIAGCRIGCVTNAAGRVGNPGEGIVLKNINGVTLGGIEGSTTANYIDDCANGVLMEDVTSACFEKNYIGSGEDGSSAGIRGVGIGDWRGKGNRMGDAKDGSLVVAACGGAAVHMVECAQGRLMGGYFGIGPDGNPAPCDAGVVMTDCTDCVIGDLMYPNYISACSNNGVAIYGAGSVSNQLGGARIGLLPNGSLCGNGIHGVLLDEASATLFERCMIAGNGQCGVFIRGTNAVGNQMMQNRIWSNGCYGISLGTIEPATNDNQDPDPGPNRLQNYPLITAVIAGENRIEGTLNSTPEHFFLLEFYMNDNWNSNNVAEGQSYFAQEWVGTDANGDATFDVYSSVTIPSGKIITATAIDMDTGDTSPFSMPFSRGTDVAELPEDSNGDGMADYWENEYPLMRDAHQDAASDYDQDGIPDCDEYIAMTDPEDADSFLRVAIDENGVVVPQSTSGRMYVLQRTALLQLAEATVWEDVSRTNGVDFETLAFNRTPVSTNAVEIYRVIVEMP